MGDSKGRHLVRPKKKTMLRPPGDLRFNVGFPPLIGVLRGRILMGAFHSDAIYCAVFGAPALPYH